MAFSRIGFGQVEPNHLSAQRTGQIYAQLPIKSTVLIDGALQNGQFVKYDYANKCCDLDGDGEWMLVYNEVKLYDDRKQMYKDFAIIPQADGSAYHTTDLHSETANPMKGLKQAYNVPGVAVAAETGDSPTVLTNVVPRVFKTNVGDIYTTNMVTLTDTYTEGTTLSIAATGLLTTATVAGPKFQVVAVTTLPDGQAGIKVMRIA